MVFPGIDSHAGSARRWAHDADLAGLLFAERADILQAHFQRIVLDGGRNQFFGFRFHFVERLQNFFRYVRINVPAHAAHKVHAVRFAISGDLFRQPHDRFADAPGLHKNSIKAEVMHRQSKPEQMTVYALEFQHHRADVFGPRRDLYPGRRLHSHAVRGAVHESADAADTLCYERHLVVIKNRLRQLLDAAMGVESPIVRADDLLAFDIEPEIGLFLQCREERPDAENGRLLLVFLAFAQRRLQFGNARRLEIIGNVFAQRIHILGPVVRDHQAPRIGMPFGNDAHHVAHFPFMPVGARDDVGQGGDAGVRRIHNFLKRHDQFVLVQRENIGDLIGAVDRVFIRAGRNDQAGLHRIEKIVRNLRHPFLVYRQEQPLRVGLFAR